MTEFSNDDSSRRSSSYEDELRLKVFLRDAAAIISIQRGLSATARLKLETLAKHQQLPARLFQQALAQLQDHDTTDSKRSRYERAFVKFLDSEFEKLRGDVLSIQVEQKAIDLATTKYQISVSRAEKLLAERAQAASLERLSRSDAEDYASKYIDEQIGDRLALDEPLLDSIHQRGQQLGLSTLRIEQTILKRLSENRRQQVSKTTSRLLVGLLLFVLMVGAGLATFSLYRASWSKNTSPMPPIKTAESNLLTDFDPQVNTAPWLSAETVGFIQRLDKYFPAHSDLKIGSLTHNLDSKTDLQSVRGDGIGSKLISTEKEVRAEGYRELATVAMNQHSEYSTEVESLFGHLFLEEPDSSLAMELLNPFVQSLRLSSSDLYLPQNSFEQQFRSNQLLAAVNGFVPSDQVLASLAGERKQELADRLKSIVGVSPKGLMTSEYLQQSEPKIASDQWSYLTQNAWSNPGQVTALVESIIELTRQKMSIDAFKGSRSRLLQTLFEVEPAQWLNLQDPLRETIATAEKIELMEWMALVRHSTDANFREFAGPLLLGRLELAVSPARDISAALDRAVAELRNRQLQPLLARNFQIETETIQFLETIAVSDQPVAPDQIAQVAVFSNLQLAMVRQLQYSETAGVESLELLDELLGKPRIRLRDIVSLPGKTNSSPIRSTATASDINRKSLALQRISNSDADQQSSRIRSLTDLEKIASRFEDLEYSSALGLADYFLSEWSDRETLNIQQRISSFSHWPTLGLAIADRITQSPPSIDKALTISRLFFPGDFDINLNSESWQSLLQLEIIRSVASHLRIRVAQDADNEHSDWIRLQYFLEETFRQRNAWMVKKDDSSAIIDSTDPAEIVLETVDTQLNRDDLPMSVVRRSQRIRDFIRRGSYNGMQKTIMADQLLADILKADAVEPPMTDRSTIEKLVAGIRENYAAQTQGDQLFLAELDLLKQFSISRHALLTQRLQGE